MTFLISYRIFGTATIKADSEEEAKEKIEQGLFKTNPSSEEISEVEIIG